MQNVTIISTSLNPESRSQDLAARCRDSLRERGVTVNHLDLRELDLPLAGSPGCWEHPDLAKLTTALEAATHVVFAVPIYCYDVNAAAKNVIELVGRAFTGKVIAFICAAGGQGSYMSVMGLANHLMLDFRAVIVPRFLYATKAAWSADGGLDPEIEGRLQLLYEDMARIAVAPGTE